MEDKMTKEKVRKVGAMTYTECYYCGDMSWCKVPMGNAEVCINEHKDEKGNVLQPKSLAVDMVGVAWEKTPAGKSKKRR